MEHRRALSSRAWSGPIVAGGLCAIGQGSVLVVVDGNYPVFRQPLSLVSHRNELARRRDPSGGAQFSDRLGMVGAAAVK